MERKNKEAMHKGNKKGKEEQWWRIELREKIRNKQ